MAREQHPTVACLICGRQISRRDAVPAELVRSSITELIRKEHPEWSPDSFICRDDLNHYRAEYVQDVLETEKGELSSIEQEVVDSLRQQDILSRNLNEDFDSRSTLGDRVADRVAEFGGSWKFIILFLVVMAAWITLNSLLAMRRPFDPYPFILLNLVLSCIAAIQAPIIMMSQNRQEAKDRLRSEHDYRVNLKAELEIRHLHAKLDELLTHQWQRLLEIQRIQMEVMEELAARRARRE
jgi:uncharacterized membrane protein